MKTNELAPTSCDDKLKLKKEKKKNKKKQKKKLKTALTKEINTQNQIKKDETVTTSSVSKTQNETKKPNEPFRRVKNEELDESYVKKFGKNGFDHKKGAQGSWGEKANKDLIHTRGKSFRHEKNKKKRGSYRGGRIDTNVCSIKFDDSD